MMKVRRCASFLLAVAMLVSLCVTAGAQEPAAGAMDGRVVVMHTNDVHGAIDGYAKVAALKESYEDRGAYVLLLDAGDFSSLRIKKQIEVKNFCRSHPAGPRRIGLAQSSGKSTLPTKE